LDEGIDGLYEVFDLIFGDDDVIFFVEELYNFLYVEEAPEVAVNGEFAMFI